MKFWNISGNYISAFYGWFTHQSFFFTYLLNIANLAIRFSEEVQCIIRPNNKYIKQSESASSKEERSNYLKETIRIALEVENRPTKNSLSTDGGNS